MKKIYTVLLITLWISKLWAQSPDKKISFLVKGGVNFSNYAASESKIANNINDKNLLGLNFGVAANYKLSNSIALQAGLGLNQKGNITQSEVQDSGPNGEKRDPFTTKFIQRVTYLELPINIVYNYKKLSLGVGPYLAYALDARSIYKSDRANFYDSQQQGFEGNYKMKQDIKIGNDETSMVKPFDFGLNFLANYELKYGVSLGANYGLGFTDASKLIFVREGKNRVFSMLVGYKFSRLKLVKEKE